MGTIRMAWGDGRTLGVCPEEDVVRKIPLEREMELLNGEPLLQCGENRWEIHCEQSVTLTSVMQSFAEEQGCDWVVKRSFIDEGLSQRPPRYRHVEADALDNLSESSDLKNGTDVGFMAKRPRSRQSMAIVAYGQGCTTPSGTYLVKELLECKLISPAATRDFRERIAPAGIRAEKRRCSCSTPQRTTFRSPRSSENARIFPALSATKVITKSVSAEKHVVQCRVELLGLHAEDILDGASCLIQNEIGRAISSCFASHMAATNNAPTTRINTAKAIRTLI